MAEKLLSFSDIEQKDIEVGLYLKVGNNYFDYNLKKIQRIM